MSNIDEKETILLPEKKLEENKKFQERAPFIFLLSFGFGLLFTICFYDFYENFNGIFYPVFVIGLFGFTLGVMRYLGTRIKKESFIFIGGAVLLGISSFLTMNFFIVAMNTMGIGILYGVFLTKQFYNESKWEVEIYLKNMIILPFQAIGNMLLPFRHLRTHKKGKNNRLEKWIPVIKGILFAILFLAVVLPLLASADMIFATVLGRFTVHLKLLFQGEWYRYLLYTVVGTLGFYGLLYAVSKNHEEIIKNYKEKREPVSALIMSWMVAAVYLFFCAIQMMYLFGRSLFELPEGITYSAYAHQGFFQLLFVVWINIGMILLCLKNIKDHHGLKISLTLISGCTFIMIISAFYRMILYVDVYHLTFLRVLVLWFLALLTIAMGGMVYYIYHRKFLINRFLFYTVLICYLIFAYIRPDYMVADYNINHMQQITASDMYYLTYLSVDAAPAFSKIKEEQLGDTAKNILNNYYNSISDSYQGGIRGFNLSHYRAWKIAKVRGK